MVVRRFKASQAKLTCGEMFSPIVVPPHAQVGRPFLSLSPVRGGGVRSADACLLAERGTVP